jgi:dUTPase
VDITDDASSIALELESRAHQQRKGGFGSTGK